MRRSATTREAMFTFEEALTAVKDRISQARPSPGSETLPLGRAWGRALAEDVEADRDYPPFHRATRDGYAVRAADLCALPTHLERLGEVRAGDSFEGKVSPGGAVEIMTGAPLPEGADAVVMLEHTRAQGSRIEVCRALGPWENVVRKGSEAAQGSQVLERGRRLGPAELGLLAAVGKSQVRVYLQPRVAILPTGDEVVPVERAPKWFQVRNSNAATLAAQVEAAGGIPVPAGVAPDQKEALRKLILEGLKSDLLLLSGGVSMGKYDLVEEVLSELQAEFFFQGVAIRPGKPVVFGRVRDKFFFGLPGNPVSTYVTFELFVRPAIAILGGAPFECPLFLRARLEKPFRQNSGLTVFMPARVEMKNSQPAVGLVGWQGSGDLVGVATANCLLVVRPGQSELAAGDWVEVMPRS